MALGFAESGFETSLPYSLKYVTGDARSLPSKRPLGCGHVPRSRFEFLDPIRTGYASTHKRAFLNSSLAFSYPGVVWSPSFWPFLKVCQTEAVKVFSIRDSMPTPARTHYFQTCYQKETKCKVYASKGGEAYYYHRCHCGEPGCFLCNDLARKRLAREWIEVRRQVVAKHPEGFKGFLDLGFTLPKDVEHLPVKDRELERKLLDAQHQFVREVFGLKVRANIAVNIAVHPIGSRDLFRDRWHSHVSVIPAVIEKGRFRWVEPVRVAKGHTSKEWKLDLEWCRRRWSEILSEVFGRPLEAIQPQVQFIPFSASTWYWRKHLKEDQVFPDAFWGKVSHQLDYSLRSFARDFENGVLRTDTEGKRFVVKVGDQKWDSWCVVDALFFVERFKEVRSHNRVSTRGWAQCLTRYADILGIVKRDPGPPPDVVGPVDADVRMVRKKQYDPDRKAVVWVRDEIYRFHCPVTGEEKSLSIKNMRRWEWGDVSGRDPPKSLEVFQESSTLPCTLNLFDKGG